MTGKGPAIVRYTMIMNEQKEYNYGLAQNNMFLACLKMRGMAALIPQEFNVPVPEMPVQALKQVQDANDFKAIRQWLDKTQTEVFAGINKFIEESYRKGELDAMI